MPPQAQPPRIRLIHLLQAALAAVLLLSAFMMSLLLAGGVALAVMAGLAWHWARRAISSGTKQPMRRPPANRFDRYRAARQEDLARAQAAFDAQAARQQYGAATVLHTPR